VSIHNATASGRTDARDVGLVYSVSVGGQSVPAVNAAADMRFLTLSEVSAELGYPILTKAERKQTSGSSRNRFRISFFIYTQPYHFWLGT